MSFRDGTSTVLLRGVNLADGKCPRDLPSHLLESLSEDAGHEFSYTGTLLPPDDAPRHLERLRYLGFNVLRIPVVWEALEHAGPGVYDEEYIDYLIGLVRLCREYGFKVIINPHQDVWSRFAGGSGAPLWTLHACGLDPSRFAETQASVRYAEWPLDAAEKDPKSIPSMMWTTNHTRLAASTVFTLFFGGRDFAPRCVIDGLNIQDYLQRHYFAAYARLAERLGDLVFAYDSMNEPEPGYIGWKNLDVSEREDSPKIGPTPSPVQSMRLGTGMAQTVDEYRLGQTGPHKTGTVKIEPKHSCWLAKEDPRWKWDRAASWPLNTCVWALHDVYDPTTGELKNPGYFDRLPRTSRSATKEENESKGPLSFISSYWQEFHQEWVRALRPHAPNAIMFIQPSVFAPPPPPRGDPLIAYSPHFYDGLTIMHRHWHERWNADVVGLLRGHYKSKVFGLRVGKGGVRKVMSEQLGQLARDAPGLPTLIGEMGIPFNLDDAKAYADGDYTSQARALDAMLAGCDDHALSYTLWAYSAANTHEWGDGWNGEDLSLACAETDSVSGSSPSSSWRHHHRLLAGAGLRAPAAWCRPYVQSLVAAPAGAGAARIKAMAFDMASSRFVLEVEVEAEAANNADASKGEGEGEGAKGGCAVLYVPWLHYRASDDDDGSEALAVEVEVSEGSWALDGQQLRWTYERGGKIQLQRKGGPLSPRELGTIVT